jgi:peptidoglycan L-alanyl-D-glutamate endopeptidase CwlK
MPTFSKKSIELLEQIHPDLQAVLVQALHFVDFEILPSTVRTIVEQKAYFDTGKSKTMNSLHLKRTWPEYANKEYTAAVDIAPYPVDWNNKERFNYLGGLIIGIANMMFLRGEIKHAIRWGGDWNGNNNPADESFYDGPHFELILD